MIKRIIKRSNLPPVYQRNGKDCYLDPIRKKLIYITPEETVRQKTISYLKNVIGVPAEMIVVEQHLSHYGIDSKRRADIVVHDPYRDNWERPIAVIECKAPEVYLDIKARDQMLDYCDLIGADYAMLTNGEESCFFHYDEDRQIYTQINDLPQYNDMRQGDFEEWETGELPGRIPFSDLKSYLQEQFDAFDEDDFGADISKLTPIRLAVPLFNLLEGLLDTRVKMPPGDYGLFTLIEDYGVRKVSYGNASGGKFFGPYRSFLVQAGENTEFYSIAVTTYCTNPDKVKTCICVAHDDEKESHHALQLVADDNVVVHRDIVDFYHNGRIAIGRIGSGKIDELRQFVRARRPEIIKGKSFYLGRLVNDRLWKLDEPAVMELIVNLISYAMIRDEYRDYVKQNI